MHVPANLTRGLSSGEVDEVGRWFRALSPSERRSLRDVRPPPRVLARFVEPGSAIEESGVDFYEHLVNHEVFLDDGPPRHICSAHEAARACLARGHVPASFRCPRGDRACPMRALVDHGGGRDVRFLLG